MFRVGLLVPDCVVWKAEERLGFLPVDVPFEDDLDVRTAVKCGDEGAEAAKLQSSLISASLAEAREDSEKRSTFPPELNTHRGYLRLVGLVVGRAAGDRTVCVVTAMYFPFFGSKAQPGFVAFAELAEYRKSVV